MADGADPGARSDMALAASAAGRAFGQAGVHIPHACSYPVAGLKHEWKPPGYPGEDRFVPHGFAVVLTAPASFRFTEPAAPERHRRAAELLRASRSMRTITTRCARAFEQLMRDVGAPAGLREIGYGEADLPELVAGAVKQQRLLVCAPCAGLRGRSRGDPARQPVTGNAKRPTYSGGMLTAAGAASINGWRGARMLRGAPAPADLATAT